MMRNNYRYSVTLLDQCQNNDIPFLYASSASVYGARHRVSRGARVRGAAQRLRLLEIPVRPATCGACCPSAPRRSPGSAISTSTARASSTRARWPSVAFHFFSQYRDRGPRPAVRGLGRLRRRRAAPRFRLGRRRGQGQPRLSRPPGALRHLQPRHRRAATFNEVALATVNACRAATAKPRADRWPSSCSTGAIEYIPFPPPLVGKYQSFTQADLTRCAPRATRRRC